MRKGIAHHHAQRGSAGAVAPRTRWEGPHGGGGRERGGRGATRRRDLPGPTPPNPNSWPAETLSHCGQSPGTRGRARKLTQAPTPRNCPALARASHSPKRETGGPPPLPTPARPRPNRHRGWKAPQTRARSEPRVTALRDPRLTEARSAAAAARGQVGTSAGGALGSPGVPQANARARVLGPSPAAQPRAPPVRRPTPRGGTRGPVSDWTARREEAGRSPVIGRRRRVLDLKRGGGDPQVA